MRLVQLAATGFRNLEPLAVSVPAEGMALIGANGHGKTNVLEAAYYPVLFRSFRGAADAEMAGFGGPGFKVECRYADEGVTHDVAVRYTASPKRKRITIDDADIERLADAVGLWLAVAFIPTDTSLASGPAAGRRLYLDRLLSLADRGYLGALTRYRAALAQRNAALKQRSSAFAAFEPALIEHGAAVVRQGLEVVGGVDEPGPEPLVVSDPHDVVHEVLDNDGVLTADGVGGGQQGRNGQGGSLPDAVPAVGNCDGHLGAQ